MKTKQHATKAKARNKHVAPKTKATSAVKRPKTTAKVATGVRAKAARRKASSPRSSSTKLAGRNAAVSLR
jgi:hypothetical protein